MRVKKKKTSKSPPDAGGDSRALFEKLLKESEVASHYQLRLYITGTSPRSSLAIANIRSLCEEFLPGNYSLEVIDIYQQPGVASKEQIIAAPTLIKEFPDPPRRLIGDLADRDRVLIGLNLSNPAQKKAEGKIHWLKT